MVIKKPGKEMDEMMIDGVLGDWNPLEAEEAMTDVLEEMDEVVVATPSDGPRVAEPAAIVVSLDEAHQSEELTKKDEEDVTFGTGIVGGKRIRNRSQSSNSSPRRLNKSSDSYLVSKLILEQAPNGEEFLTTRIGEKYRAMGKTTNSLSGQLYAKKQSGLLTNRSSIEDETEIFGKVKVWQATPKFYDYMKIMDQTNEGEENND